MACVVRSHLASTLSVGQRGKNRVTLDEVVENRADMYKPYARVRYPASLKPDIKTSLVENRYFCVE